MFYDDNPIFLPLPHPCSIRVHLEVTLCGPEAIRSRRVIYLPRELKTNEALGQGLSNTWLELAFPYWCPIRAGPSPLNSPPWENLEPLSAPSWGVVFRRFTSLATFTEGHLEVTWPHLLELRSGGKSPGRPSHPVFLELGFLCYMPVISNIRFVTQPLILLLSMVLRRHGAHPGGR